MCNFCITEVELSGWRGRCVQEGFMDFYSIIFDSFWLWPQKWSMTKTMTIHDCSWLACEMSDSDSWGYINDGSWWLAGHTCAIQGKPHKTMWVTDMDYVKKERDRCLRLLDKKRGKRKPSQLWLQCLNLSRSAFLFRGQCFVEIHRNPDLLLVQFSITSSHRQMLWPRCCFFLHTSCMPCLAAQ